MDIVGFSIVAIVAFLSSYLGVELIRRWALKENLLDIPNYRSSHVTITPRGGGIAISSILVLGLLISILWFRELNLKIWFSFLGALLLVAGIGIIEDIQSLSVRLRLFVQLVASIGFILITGYFRKIYLPIVGEIDFNWLGLPITCIWIVGLTNVFNFMDGIDGIAAGQSIIAGFFWFLVCLHFHIITLAVFTILILSTSLGFLIHNSPPAKIFMGDIGSTVLGFSFAALPVLVYRISGNTRLFITGLIFVSPFIFDSSLTFLKRLLRHENIFQPHCSHLYQRLVKSGYSHGFVSLLYAIFALFAGIMGLGFLVLSDSYQTMIIVSILLFLVCYAIIVSIIERKRMNEH